MMKTIYQLHLLKALSVESQTSILNLSLKLGFSQGSVALAIKGLKQTGLIETRSGTHGGIRLTKPYEAILVKDILSIIPKQESILRAFADHVQDDLLCVVVKSLP